MIKMVRTHRRGCLSFNRQPENGLSRAVLAVFRLPLGTFMPNHTPTQIIQTAQQCALAQRAQQANHLKRWKQAAFAVAIFPPLLSLILAWQRTGELPTSLLLWFAVMLLIAVNVFKKPK